MPSGYSHYNPFQRERTQLARAIKKLRRERKMTQENLAYKASVNVSYLAKIENGYINTTIRYLIKLARGLGVRVRDLFDF